MLSPLCVSLRRLLGRWRSCQVQRSLNAAFQYLLRLGSVALSAGIAVSPAATGWQSVGRLPFAFPIAVGTISAVTANYFGFL